MPKIERTQSSVATARAQVVTRPSGTPAPAPSAPPAATFAGQAVATRPLIPNGTPVSKSASPNALWGEQPKPVSLDRAAFEKLPPAEQKDALHRCEEERDRVGGEIEQRVEQLDRRWKYSRLVTRTEALRDYQEGSEHLSPRRRRQLDGLLDRSESAQKRINELRAQIDKLPKTPEAKKQQAELRSQLAKELRRARDEQSKVVKEATEMVDADGLKVDRLAQTEQIIDPSAPKPGSGETLLEKVTRFLHLDGFITWVKTTFTILDDVRVSQAAQAQKRQEAVTADHEERVKFRIENDRRLAEVRKNLEYLSRNREPAVAS